jgi:hypothetical protein
MCHYKPEIELKVHHDLLRAGFHVKGLELQGRKLALSYLQLAPNKIERFEVQVKRDAFVPQKLEITLNPLLPDVDVRSMEEWDLLKVRLRLRV